MRKQLVLFQSKDDCSHYGALYDGDRLFDCYSDPYIKDYSTPHEVYTNPQSKFDAWLSSDAPSWIINKLPPRLLEKMLSYY